MSMAIPAQRSAGELLREWRDRRRLSQMDLALDAGVSTRHLSFVETGRAAPSREMVLKLAEHLEVPLRERNHLLLAAGYAPVYAQHAMDTPEMAPVREALRRVLRGHDPFPAVVVDRHWTLIEGNAGIALMTGGVAPHLLEGEVNVLRLSLHPDGLAPRIANLGEWRAHILGRLRRQVALTADHRLTELLDELRAYPCDDPVPEVEVPGPGDVVLTLRLHGGLTFLSTVATFGTPLDVTVAELVIESFYPADEATAIALRGAGVGG
jgi:transcriptional regulator with XRE-family HTH domain